MNNQNNAGIIQKGTEISIGEPSRIPDGMPEALSEFFRKTGQIKKAYLLWMEDSEGGGYLLCLDFDAITPETIPQIGELTTGFISGQRLDIIPVNHPLGQSASRGMKPFFEADCFGAESGNRMDFTNKWARHINTKRKKLSAEVVSMLDQEMNAADAVYYKELELYLTEHFLIDLKGRGIKYRRYDSIAYIPLKEDPDKKKIRHTLMVYDKNGELVSRRYQFPEDQYENVFEILRKVHGKNPDAVIGVNDKMEKWVDQCREQKRFKHTDLNVITPLTKREYAGLVAKMAVATAVAIIFDYYTWLHRLIIMGILPGYAALYGVLIGFTTRYFRRSNTPHHQVLSTTVLAGVFGLAVIPAVYVANYITRTDTSIGFINYLRYITRTREIEHVMRIKTGLSYDYYYSTTQSGQPFNIMLLIITVVICPLCAVLFSYRKKKRSR